MQTQSGPGPYPWHAIKYCEHCRRMTPHGKDGMMSWCDDCATTTQAVSGWTIAVLGLALVAVTIWYVLTWPINYFRRN